MSKNSTHPRILFVTPEAAFMPEAGGNRTNFIRTGAGGFGDFPAELISHLFELGADVHVAQPDFRGIFANNSWQEKVGDNVNLPGDRVHLAEDRAIFYSKPINSNSEWENIKISLVFQREVINQIIPRVQPDLIHCFDWMTGLIPAAAQKNGISCIFSVQKFDTARCLLSYVEDIGIDAGRVWQSLYFDRYPGSYEQTRDSNPLDLLLSGILAASHVNTASQALLPNLAEAGSDFMYSPLGTLLVQKWKAGCAFNTPGSPLISLNLASSKKPYSRYRFQDHHVGKQKNDHANCPSIPSSENRTRAKSYMDFYETLLQRPLVISENKKVRSINKGFRTKKSGVQATPSPKTDSTKSNPHPKEWISTPAVAPI